MTRHLDDFDEQEPVPSAYPDLPKHRYLKKRPAKDEPGIFKTLNEVTIAPPPDLSDDGREGSRVWAASKADAIRFHHRRGMSLDGLVRIYGRAAVLQILGCTP